MLERICEQFPERAAILRAAFEAHEAGTYVLAIPAFLAQADGIAYDYLKVNFFRTKQWRARFQKFMEGTRLTGFATFMAIPLERPGVLRVPTKELDERDDLLNRHQVLHGLRCDYGTEINSLKCIGLLDYIHSVGERILTQEPEKEADHDAAQ